MPAPDAASSYRRACIPAFLGRNCVMRSPSCSCWVIKNAAAAYYSLACEQTDGSPTSSQSEQGGHCVIAPQFALAAPPIGTSAGWRGACRASRWRLGAGAEIACPHSARSAGQEWRAPATAPERETDADPGDEPGNGRGVARGGRSLGPTDADPGDEPGRGRGGNGVTDADPGGMPGRGRGGGREAGPTDADPGDPMGRGRGGAPPQLRTGMPAKKA